MTQSRFRALLLVSMVAGLASAFVDLVFPALLPDSFVRVQEDHDAAASFPRMLVLLGVGIAAVVGYVTSIVGLYQFRHWAPKVAGISTALTLMAFPLFGAQALSGAAQSLSYLASYLWGAVLVLAYVSPSRMWFRAKVNGGGGENDA